jgi:hypothetical protein
VAGLVAASAQTVYSVNSVGYVNVDIPNAGFHLVANPLKTSANTLNDLLPDAPGVTYTKVFKWNGAGYDSSNFIASFGWAPNLTLDPGEGAFLQTSGAASLTFVGEVPQAADSNGVTLAPGFSLVSSKVPQTVDLNDAAFNFPAGDTGDKVFRFDSVGQTYVSSTFIDTIGFNPAPAVQGIAPGESFFYSSVATTDKTWDRNFDVNQ